MFVKYFADEACTQALSPVEAMKAAKARREVANAAYYKLRDTFLAQPGGKAICDAAGVTKKSRNKTVEV